MGVGLRAWAVPTLQPRRAAGRRRRGGHAHNGRLRRRRPAVHRGRRPATDVPPRQLHHRVWQAARRRRWQRARARSEVPGHRPTEPPAPQQQRRDDRRPGPHSRTLVGQRPRAAVVVLGMDCASRPRHGDLLCRAVGHGRDPDQVVQGPRPRTWIDRPPDQPVRADAGRHLRPHGPARPRHEVDAQHARADGRGTNPRASGRPHNHAASLRPHRTGPGDRDHSRGAVRFEHADLHLLRRPCRPRRGPVRRGLVR